MWHFYPISELGKTFNDKNIGKIILTKKVGSDEREDITHLYKYPEDSEEEKKAFNTAYRFGKGPALYPNMLNYEEEGNELTIGMSILIFQKYYEKQRKIYFISFPSIIRLS